MFQKILFVSFVFFLTFFAMSYWQSWQSWQSVEYFSWPWSTKSCPACSPSAACAAPACSQSDCNELALWRAVKPLNNALMVNKMQNMQNLNYQNSTLNAAANKAAGLSFTSNFTPITVTPIDPIFTSSAPAIITAAKAMGITATSADANSLIPSLPLIELQQLGYIVPVGY